MPNFERLKKYSVVVAHPDDEILGCGATLAKMARTGYSVHSVIVSEGITSRKSKDSKWNFIDSNTSLIIDAIKKWKIFFLLQYL